MSPEPNIGRVSIDVVSNEETLRAKIEAAVKNPFEIHLQVTKRELAGLRGQINTALANPFKVRIEVDDKGIARVVKKTETAQKSMTLAETKGFEQRKTNRSKFFNQQRLVTEKARLEENLVEKKAGAEVLKTETKGFEQRKTNRSKFFNTARLEEIKANNKSLLAQSNHERELTIIATRGEEQRLTDKRRHNQQDLNRSERHANSLELIQTRLDARLRGSALSSFQGSVTRFSNITGRALSTSAIAFTAWSAAVGAAVGAAAVAGVAAFAKLELASTRAGAVVASQKIADEMRENGRAISDFATVTESARKRIQAVSERVGLATLFSPAEVTAGIQALLQAGQSMDEALKNIGSAANFASVNELDLAEASDRLAAGLAAAGLSAKDSNKLIDQISFTAQSALGDAGDFLEAFANRGASSFAAYGKGIEETLTLLALLGQAGTTGRSAGTQASIVLRDIAKAADKSAPAFKRYGIAVKTAETPTVTFNETLVSLATAIQTAQKGNSIPKLRKELGFMDRSFGSILQIVPQINNLGATGLQDFAEGLANSTGTVAKQADVFRKTIAFQFGNLLDTLTVVAARFGEAAGSGVSIFFNELAGSGGLIDQATPTIQRFGRAFGAMVERATKFVQTEEFAQGIKNLVEAVRVTLQGVGDAFGAFGKAGEGGSAFVGFTEAVLGFSRAAATFLPIAAAAIGEVIDAIVSHPDAFKSFAIAATGVYALNKAFLLVISPAITAVSTIVKFMTASGGAGAALQIVGRVLLRFAGWVGVALAAIDVAIGFVRGFRDEWARLAASDSFATFKVGLDAISAALRFVGDVMAYVTQRLQGEGAKWGTALADTVFLLVTALGAAVNFIKASTKAITDQFWAMVRGIGDAIRSLVEGLADVFDKIGSLKGGGQFREWANDLHEAGRAVDGWGVSVETAAAKTTTALAPIPKFLRNTRTGTWRLNQQWVRATEVFKTGATSAVDGVKRISNAVMSRFPGATKAVQGFSDAIVEGAANSAAAAEFDRVFRTLSADNNDAEPQSDALIKAGNAAAVARQRALDLYPAIRLVGKASEDAANKTGGGGGGGGGGGSPTLTGGLNQVADAAQRASAAVNAMSNSAIKSSAIDIIGRATKSAADGYKATRVEAEILKRVLPSLEKDLEAQKAVVTQLDNALRDLQNTQLKGTKSFSDQLFSLDQQTKALDLQRLDLIIGGATDEDAGVKALDAQIAALRQQAERTNLVESLQLDPLRRKIEDTFTPVKELSFEQIMGQFKDLNEKRAPLIDAITGGEQLKAVLDTTIANAEARFEGAGKQVSLGLARGIRAGTKAVFDGASFVGNDALRGLDSVMSFGSPSRTMHQRGAWITQGVANGILAAAPAAQAVTAGVGNRVMASFEAGMRQRFGDKDAKKGTIAYFLHVEIPAMIRDLKGPVAYDATILVPAGEAIMHGLDRGLRSGFGGVADFLRDVGPSMEEFVPDSMFADRTKQFMVDVAMGKDPKADEFFADLLPDQLGGFGGTLDPTLAFLHKTLSLADTQSMAAHLAKLFGLTVTSTDRAAGTLTSSGNVSDHTFGTAADISGSVSNTDRLAAALKPLYGNIFKQLIWHNEDLNRGFFVPDHEDHLHAAWLMGGGFNKYSGKKGAPAVTDIPGASPLVDLAISNAAKAYGASLQGLANVAKAESGFNVNAANMWDINAALGHPSRGLFQFIEPTFNSFVERAIKANSGAWMGIAKNWLDPKAQALVAAWAFTHGLGSHWATASRYFGGAREKGGPVNPRQAFLVGERGPELFMPRSAGNIVPAGPTASMMSNMQGRSTSYNPTYNIMTNATDPRAVAAVVDAHSRNRIGGVNLR